MIDRSRRVLVMGSGSAGVATALRSADFGVRIVITSELSLQNSLNLLIKPERWVIADPLSDDPFCGGCRSKGEKKRAARERRIRGGF